MEYPCTLTFFSFRYNIKVSNSIVIYARCRRDDLHKQNFRFEIEQLDSAVTILSIRSSSEFQFRHKESDRVKYQQIRDKRRKSVGKTLQHRSPRSSQLQIIKDLDKDMWDRGYPQNLATMHTFNKIKSKANMKNRLKLQNKDIEDLMQLWIEENKLKDPYRRSVGLPLRATMFTKEQLQLVQSKDRKIVHMNGTGSIARKPFKCPIIMHYCLVCRLSESVMPVAEMLTAEHDTKSISIFLKEIKSFVLQETNTWPFFKAIVIDWSWPSIHGIAFEWNNMKVNQYLDITYDYLVNNKKPSNITILLTCVAHVIHKISKNIDKHFPDYIGIIAFLLNFVSLLLLCRHIV